ncbi:MAG: RNA pseudouridine synthase [Lachnospiraceae bacterium]|nr:RNA pseudouridine synthase [Lachnospiraceae bacterium]
MFNSKQILMENDEILVVYKPAGIAVQSGSVGQMDLEHQLLGYLSAKGRGREIPYLAVLHRLDQPVEGVLLFAKTKEAAARCSEQVRNGKMKKEYLAVVSPAPAEKTALLTDYLLRDGKTNSSRVVKAGSKEAKKSQLSYEVLEEKEDGQALLRIRLMTGRHHQIRVQLAHAGMPIIGDHKYGKQEENSSPTTKRRGKSELLLCAAALTFENPVDGKPVRIEISPKGSGFQNFKQVTI